MTITIDEPKAPPALPDGHQLRRDWRDGSTVKPGINTRRYLTTEWRDLAAAYFEERHVAKFLRAYLNMSPTELPKFIGRLESGTSKKSPAWNLFRLEVARKAQALREAEGISVPSIKIPSDATKKDQQELLRFHIKDVEDRLKQLKDSADTGTRNALAVCRSELYRKLEELKPKKKTA